LIALKDPNWRPVVAKALLFAKAPTGDVAVQILAEQQIDDVAIGSGAPVDLHRSSHPWIPVRCKDFYRLSERSSAYMLQTWRRQAFSILTTEPGPHIAPYHDRQIVIFDRDACADGSMRPFPQSL
jgi:hypothetical protein